MSNDYATRIALAHAAQAADPAVIAAGVKEHEREQQERQAWHTKRGRRLIDLRRERATESVTQLEERVANLRLEHQAIRDGLARGTMTAEDASQRWQSAVSARQSLPAEIDQVTEDMESTSDLDPVEESGQLLRRFPALAARVGTAIPPLPEPNGNSNGDGD